MKNNLIIISRNVSFIKILNCFDFSAILFNRLLTIVICCAVLALSSAAQTIRKVEVFSPPVGNASSNEVAVVNSTGLVYNFGQAFGSNIGVIDPATNTLIKSISNPNPNNPSNSFYSRVNQTTNIVYFLQQNSLILPIDGRPASPTFNQSLPPVSFANQTVRSFYIDQTRNLLYASTRTTGSNPVQSQIQTVDINPASATFNQSIGSVALPSGQAIDGIAVNSVTNKIYVTTNSQNGGVFVLNAANQNLTLIAGTLGAVGVAVNEATNVIYATKAFISPVGVFVIDGANDSLMTSVSVSNIRSSSTNDFIAINSTTNRIYLAANDNILNVLDGDRTSASFNSIIAAIPNVGNHRIALDEGINKIIVTSSTQKTTIVDGATNTITATTFGNLGSQDVAVNPITHRAYVAHVFYMTQAINLNDNSYTNIETTVEIGETIVNPNNNLFYFPRNGAVDNISYLNTNDNIGVVPGLPHGFGRYIFAAQNTVTNRVYMVNSASNSAGTNSQPGYISVINGATNNIIANVEVGGQPFGNPAVNEATNKIYVPHAGSGSSFPSKLMVIDGATNIASNIDTSAFPANSGFYRNIAANPTTNKIYFQVSDGTSVGVINGATNVATILPGYTGVSNILVNPSLNRIYFLTSTGIRVLDGSNNTEIANIALSGNIVLNKTTNRIFVHNSQNQTITAIDGNTNTVVATAPLNATTGITVNEATNRLYVGNYDDFNDESTSSILFIDGNTLAVENTLPIPLRPGRISVNSATRTLYVTTVNASQRTGLVVISDTNPCTFTLSPTSSTALAAGESNKQINVSNPQGCPWTAESNAGWLTVIGGATGSGNGTVTYSVAANSGAQRTGTITVAGQTFTVNQTAASTANPYVVTNTNDSGAGSLRQAILDANATAADDTINFNLSGCPNGVCTITLLNGELAINAASTAGKLTITNSTGASSLLISGNNASRVFFLNTGANLMINGVTITRGNGTGTTSSGFGGGIFNNGGTATLTNSAVSGNTGTSGGGGIYNSFAFGTTILTNSTVSGNTANGIGGGGIYSSGTTTLTNSIVSGNTVNSGNSGFGGGVYNSGSGTLTLTGSTVSGNMAYLGGGIINFGRLALTNSIVSGNTADSGGGINNQNITTTLTNSTVSGNMASNNGGGIDNRSGATLTLNNSTVSGNTGLIVGGIGNSGTVNLNNVTVTRNQSFNANCPSCAGGIRNFTDSTANLRNTIVAGNIAANASSPDFRGAVEAMSSNNLIGNGTDTTGITNGTNNNQVGTNTNPIDARLASLGNYGGTTQTHALLSNSPAIDAGSNCVIDLTCSSNNPPAALTTDQRGAGFPRKVGSAVDIGAFEATSYTVSTPVGQSISVTPTSNLNLNFGTVMTAGNTVATVLSPNQLQPLPSGFTLFGSNLIYDITTSAVFSGNITVTFAVPNVADAATCSNLRSLHYENGAWTTNTNATPIYNAGAQICTVAQTVTSLSPFAVVLQTPASFSYEADVSPRPGGDGFVDADDIQQIRLFSVGGGLPYQSNEFQRVDCSPRSTSGDGFLDSDDVQQARRYSVGTDSSQLAGGPSSGSAPFQLDSAASAIDETFDSSTLFTNRKSKRSSAFHIGGQINNADQTITVPVLIDTMGKEAGYTFSLSYDAEMLTNPQVTIGNAGGDVVYKANTSGEIGFSVTSFFGETIAPGANQVLVNVTFTVAANTAAGTAAINFTDVLARRKASGVDPNSAITQPTYTGGVITIGAARTIRNSFSITND